MLPTNVCIANIIKTKKPTDGSKVKKSSTFFGQGALVGLLDADVYGPSIPKMMNLSGPVQLTKRECKVPQMIA